MGVTQFLFVDHFLHLKLDQQANIILEQAERINQLTEGRQFTAFGNTVVVRTFKKGNITTTITETKDIDENVVYVYHSKQSVNVPSISPLCLAFETFLRMTETEYKKTSNEKKAEKMHGDPKMMLNRQEMIGLESCFETVGNTFATNLARLADCDLSADQKADAEAFIKAEVETVLFCILSIVRAKKRTEHRSGAYKLIKRIRNGVHQLLKPKEIDDRNMSKLSVDELTKKAKDTLTSLENYIQRGGERKYFFGDKPTRFDSILFGVLAQYYFDAPQEMNLKEYFDETVPKLADYLKRVKETYWADWDQCVMVIPAPKVVENKTAESAPTDKTTEPATAENPPQVNGAATTPAAETAPVVNGVSHADDSVEKCKKTEDVTAVVVVAAAEAPIAAADASTPSGEVAVNGTN